MPISHLLKASCIMAVGAAIGYSSMKYIQQPNENNRQIASLTYSKLGTDYYAKTLFDIKIQNIEVALKADEVSTVKVTIEAFKIIPAGLSYSWTLPENVTLVEGPQSGELQDFSAGQKKEIIVKVKGYSKEIQNHLSFFVKGSFDDKKIERDALISSRPEDSFEYVVQNYEKARATESKKLNKLGVSNKEPLVDPNKVSF